MRENYAGTHGKRLNFLCEQTEKATGDAHTQKTSKREEKSATKRDNTSLAQFEFFVVDARNVFISNLAFYFILVLELRYWHQGYKHSRHSIVEYWCIVAEENVREAAAKRAVLI